MLRPKFVISLAPSARGALGVGIQQGLWHGVNFDLNVQRELLKLSKAEGVQIALPEDNNGLSAAHDSGPSATILDTFLLSGEEEGQRRKPFSSSRFPGIIGHPLEPQNPSDVAADRAAAVAVGRADDVARVLSVPEQLFSQNAVLQFGMAPVVGSLRNPFLNNFVPRLSENGFRNHPGRKLHVLRSFSQQNRHAPASASGATPEHEAESAAKAMPSSILAKVPLRNHSGSLLAAKNPSLVEIGNGGQHGEPMVDTPCYEESPEGFRPAAVAASGFGGHANASNPGKLLSAVSGLSASPLSPRRESSSLSATSAAAAAQPSEHMDGSSIVLRDGTARTETGAVALNITRRRQAVRQGGQLAAAGSTLSGTRFQECDVGNAANQSPDQVESSEEASVWREKTKPFVSEVLLSLRKMHLQAIAQGATLDAGHVEEALKWTPFVDKYAASLVLKQESDPDIAMAFFDWAKGQEGFEVDCYHYTTLIGIAGRAKAGEMLQKVVAEMEARGINKDSVTYSRMIHAFGMLGMHEKALATAKEMEAEGVPIGDLSSQLMDLHFKAHRMKECLQVFEKLNASGLPVEGIQAALAMKALAATGRAKEAVQLFEERRAQLSSPCLLSYNTIIDVLAKSGRFEKALEVFEQLQRTGAAINMHTYTSAIDMCGKERRFSEAERIFDEMEAAGVTQDAKVWNSMVSMWGRAEKPRRAAFWFRRMLQSGVTPTVQCYGSLMSSFLRADMFDEAKLVLTSMLSRGVKPSLFTYAIVLSECTLCKSERGVVAMMNLLDMMKHPGQKLLRGLLQIAKQKEGDLLLQEGPVRAQVNAVWDQVDREDYESKSALADSVIEFLTKYEARQTAAHFLDMVHKRGIFTRIIVPDGDNRALKVDLHNMSTGTALVALSWIFRCIREGVLDLSLPLAEMHIVTGTARRAKVRETSRIRDVVVDHLTDAQSPFQLHRHTLVAPMASVERWLTSDTCLNVFALVDNC